jgi:hypothetical protein
VRHREKSLRAIKALVGRQSAVISRHPTLFLFTPCFDAGGPIEEPDCFLKFQCISGFRVGRVRGAYIFT